MEIGIWGDSIVYGQNDSEALGWVGRLRKSYPIEEYVGVYNRGVCGDTTEDLLKRFNTEVKSIKPDTIIFAIGINDSKYPKGEETNLVHIERFRENLSNLVTQARVYTNTIYIVSCTSVKESPRPSGTWFSNEEIARYNVVLKELADAEHLTFIDVSKTLDTSTDLDDGLHPNAQGYEKLFEFIRSKIA